MNKFKKGFTPTLTLGDRKSKLVWGFTLIELLVVVAVIGLLATLVVAALDKARNKGNDRAVMSNLRNALNQADIIRDTRITNKDSYTNVCTDGLISGETTVKGIGAMILAAAKASGLSTYGINNSPSASLITATCNNSATAWAAEVPLKETPNSMWCVDSLGRNKKTITSMEANTSCL